MPRIRTIKPDFFESESLAQCSMEARLVFIGLFTIADDEGRLKDLPKKLAGEIFPHDEIGPTEMCIWLDELENAHCIERYAHENAHFLHIPQWSVHQRIAHPTPSRLPAPPSEKKADREILGEIPQSSENLSIGSRNKEVGSRKRNVSSKDEHLFGEKFEEAWKIYPRRQSKKLAFAAWCARIREGVSPDDLLNAVANYQAVTQANRTEPRFILLPATFFGPHERWKDYEDAVSATQSPMLWGVASDDDFAVHGDPVPIAPLAGAAQ